MPPKSGQGKIKIPQKDVVKFFIKETLQNRKAMSQKELARMIAKELRRGDNNYRITGKRARMIALGIPVKLGMETRHGPAPKRCPCCGHGLKRAYSKNLLGRKILTTLRCNRCAYRGIGGRWVPRRYYFSL